MIRRLLVTSTILMLAACGVPDSEGAPAASPAVPAPPAIPASPATTDAITAEGWGPLRIGMTRAEVETVLGADANPNALGGPDTVACDIFHPERAPEGLTVIVEKGVLTSLWLNRGATLKTESSTSPPVGPASSTSRAAPDRFRLAIRQGLG